MLNNIKNKVFVSRCAKPNVVVEIKFRKFDLHRSY